MSFGENVPHEEPSDFARSAVLFIVTMTVVFGLGMTWQTYGDVIVRKWNKDWNGMKTDWEEATTAPPIEENPMMFGAFPYANHAQADFDRISRELDDYAGRHDRGVVPMIDTRKPKFK